MKSFLKDTLLFIAFLLTYFGLNYGINQYFIQLSSPQIEKRILIMGDSHIEASIDPTAFPSAISVAQSVEPYFISYWKLKSIMHKSKIDTLILGFSYNNLAESYDDVLHNLWCLEMFKRIYPIAELNTLKGLKIKWKEYGLRKFKNMCIAPRPNHVFYMGDFSGLDSTKNNLDAYLANVSRHFSKSDGTNFGVSSTSVEFLNKIVAFCQTNNIKLILVGTPLHEKYRENIPSNFEESYAELINTFQKKGVTIYNYSEAVFTDTDFFDVDHLNIKGAKQFTASLIRNNF